MDHDENVLELDDEKVEKLNKLLADEDNPNISGLLSELESDIEYTINIYRQSGNGKKRPFLFSCEAGEYNFGEIQEKLKNEYKGGDFHLHVLNNKGHFVTRRTFSVEAPLEKEEKDNSNSADLANIILSIRESQQQSIDQMREMMQKQSDNNQTVLIEMIKAQGNKSETPQLSPLDMVKMIVQLKELSAPATQDNQMETFLKGLEFGKEMNGENNDSVLQTALKTFGKPLVDMTEKMAALPSSYQPQPQPAEQTPAHPSANLPPPPPNNINSDQEDQEMLLHKLKEFKPILDYMVSGAQQNSDPDIYANFLLDQLGQDAAIILNDENYNKLFAFIPSIAPLRPWFDQVKSIALDYLADNEDDAGDDSDTTSDDAHVFAEHSPENQEFIESESSHEPGISNVEQSVSVETDSNAPAT